MHFVHRTLDRSDSTPFMASRRRAQRRCAASAPLTARGGALAVALVLAACVHSPQAAVASAGGAAPLSASTVVSQVQGAAGIASCSDTPAARAALQNITREVQAQGLAFQASCQAASSGWVVQVRVTDGVKASKVVRGPLADGHDVDMGTPAGVSLAGASTASGGFSPDVQHNRQWLHALMARHHFDNLPDAWWHFAQRGAAPAQGLDTDLAAR